MSQTINRMFESLERANEAAHVLRTHRFDRFSDVFVVSGPASAEAIVEEFVKARVLKAHAKVFAQRLSQGGAMVTVHAPFGMARAAINILESFGPVDSGVPDFSDPPPAWDDATPLSSTMGWPTLIDPTDSFSRFWSLPLLLKSGATTSSALGLPELSAKPGPFTGSFGSLPLLSNNPAWLSSKLGLPLLLSSAKKS